VIKAIDSRDDASQKRLAADREIFSKMLMIVKIAQQKFVAIKDGLSSQTLASFEQILASEAEPSATLKLIKALSNTILATSLKLTLPTKKELGIGKQNWTQKLSRNDIEWVLAKACQKIRYKEKPKKPVAKPRPKKKPEARTNWDFRVNLGAGYGYGPALSSNGDSPLLSGPNQGYLATAAAAVEALFSKKLSLRLDYWGRLVVADDLQETRQGADDATFTTEYDSGKLKLRGGVEGLRYGSAASEPEEDDQKLKIAAGRGGVTLKLGELRPALDGVVGYELSEGRVVYGGRLGGELRLGKEQGIEVNVDYVMDILGGRAGYSYNTATWGIGPFAVYRLMDGEHRVGGGIEGRYTPGKLLGEDLALQISVNSDYAVLSVSSGGAKASQPSLLQRAVDPYQRGMQSW
jgi:hypothetical protein